MGEGLTVEVHGEGLELDLEPSVIEEAIRHVLRAEGVDDAAVSVALVGDARIAELNREYLDHPGPTDVISFPLSLPGSSRVVGDVYVGAEQARRQADEAGVSLREELLRLAIHGALHVLGFDHPAGDDRERSPMYLKQEALLAEIMGPRSA